jgi:alkylhydroperoxidase/carboxymuconolactone decarboxylase family protein YurZ
MSTPQISWINEQQATGQLAEIYRAWFARNPERREIPEILKCFSHRPDFLQNVMDFSYGVHFSEGHLTRRTKEMIATYVSVLNQCPY